MKITTKEFEEMFFKNTAQSLGDKLGVSRTCINYYAKKLGLSKGKGFYQKKVNFVNRKMWSKES